MVSLGFYSGSTELKNIPGFPPGVFIIGNFLRSFSLVAINVGGYVCILNLTDMSQLLEQLKTMSEDDLRDRLCEITPTIEFLTTHWNRPFVRVKIGLITGSIFPNRFGEVDEQGLKLCFPGKQPEIVKEFLHNLCTQLCAEKLMIESLLPESEPH